MKVAMNKPALYHATNHHQRETTLGYLKQYANKIKWNKMGNTGVDIGCADGASTIITKNFAPYGYKKFVACDKHETMLKYASEKYANEGITFRQLDIEGKIPDDMVGAFDHVFSFYVLHWVRNQEQAFKNLHKLMADNGDCLMSFIANTSIYTIYKVLANYPKWQTWLKETDLFVSPYYGMKNPEIKVQKLLEKCDFKNIEVQFKPHKFCLDDIEQLKVMVQSVEPFSMPQEVFDDFIQDYIKVGQEIGSLTVKDNEDSETKSVSYDYSLIVVSANK